MTARGTIVNDFDDHFGRCPRCGGDDGYLNHGRDHWMVCHRCRVRWYIGSNLFSSWKDMTEDERDRDWLTLSGYEAVKTEPVPIEGDNA